MKRKLAAIITTATMLMCTASVGATLSEQDSNPTNIKKGIIAVGYESQADKGLKVIIEKDSKKYQYNLVNDGAAEVFPLQMGNGSYKVNVYENIEGNRYAMVSTDVVTLALKDQKVVYKNSIQPINWNTESNAVAKAKELTKGLTNENAKIAAIYNYMINNFTYDYEKLATVPSSYIPNPDRTLEEGTGICYDFSSLFSAMLRSLTIPTRLVKGYSKNVVEYHAWNEVYVKSKGKWVIVDTTYDMQMKAAGYESTFEKSVEDYTKKYDY